MLIIRARDYRIMTWKNGLGRTDEILVEPADADLSGFACRISMAHVDADGPFSRFDGIDRTLAVLEGGPVSLDFGGSSVVLSPSDPPFSFSGDSPVTARIAGPLVDLNVMTRRGVMAHRVECLALGDGHVLVSGQERLFLFVTAPARIDVDGQSILLERHDTAVVEGSSTLTVSGQSGHCYSIHLTATVDQGLSGRKTC